MAQHYKINIVHAVPLRFLDCASPLNILQRVSQSKGVPAIVVVVSCGDGGVSRLMVGVKINMVVVVVVGGMRTEVVM